MCGSRPLKARERFANTVGSEDKVISDRVILDKRNTNVFQLVASLAGLGSRFEIASFICMSTAEMLKRNQLYEQEEQ